MLDCVCFYRCVFEAPGCSHAGPASNKVPAKSKGKAAADSKKKPSAAAKKPPAKKALAKKSPAKKSTAKHIQSDEGMSDADIEVSVEEEEQQQETQGEPGSTQDEQPSTSQAAKGRKGGKRAAAIRPGPGSVKAGAIAGTPDFKANSPRYSACVLSKCFPISYRYSYDIITAFADDCAAGQTIALRALSSELLALPGLAVAVGLAVVGTVVVT